MKAVGGSEGTAELRREDGRLKKQEVDIHHSLFVLIAAL